MIRVAQYRGTSEESKAIKFLTRSKWSHTAIIFDRGFSWRDSKGVALVVEPGNVFEAWNSGIRVVRSLADQHTPGTIVDIFSQRVPFTEDQFTAMARFWCEQVGKEYAWRDALRFLPYSGNLITSPAEDLPYSKYTKWFCSEVAAAGFELAGLPLFNFKKAWQVEPADVPESLLFDPNCETATI
jgi:uncharacterized protein YycO